MRLYWNPFIDTNFNPDYSAVYTPLSGSEYYSFSLRPAKDENEQLLQGTAVSTYTFTGGLSNYLIDYAFYDITYDHPVPSGYSWWQWETSTNGIRASNLYQYIGEPSNTLPATNPYVLTLYRETANSDHCTIEGFSQGWYLVLERFGSTIVYDYNTYLDAQLEEQPLVIYCGSNPDRIKGCYRIYEQRNADAVSAIEQQAYTDGYQDGLNDSQVEFSPFRYISQAGAGIGALFDVQIFPNVSLGVLVMIPLAITILGTIIKILRK